MTITLDFAGKRIVLDGAEKELLALIEAVRKLAPTLPQLTVNSVGTESPPTSGGAVGGAGSASNQPQGRPGERSTMRDFVRGLNPKTHSEKIAAIAYFVSQFENRPSFSPKEMDGWYTACNLAKPSTMSIALSDAKKLRYVFSAGYGQWKLDRDGENWVIGQVNRTFSSAAESGKD